MGQDQTKLLQKQLFDIKFTAKQLTRESKKAEKRMEDHKMKLKQAIEKQDMERAKICAENAIREKQQSLSLLKLASRMESVAQRVEQALVMGRVTKAMGKTVDGMEAVFKTMDAAKISKVMDRFEKACDEMDIKTAVMGDELDRTNETSVPAESVQSLMKEVADKHGLELADSLQTAPLSRPDLDQHAVQENDLEARLRNLG